MAAFWAANAAARASRSWAAGPAVSKSFGDHVICAPTAQVGNQSGLWGDLRGFGLEYVTSPKAESAGYLFARDTSASFRVDSAFLSMLRISGRCWIASVTRA